MNYKKNTVFNMPREMARGLVEAKNSIWISIGEPEKTFQRVSNPFLEQSPFLKIEFWDVTKVFDYGGEIFTPPTDEDAQKIVDFILDNPGKDIIVNCAAGISRSGAVCQFCEDVLMYKWHEPFKKRAVPNILLYSKMLKYYRKINGLDYEH
jgi:predicted protein tyrosine phosphatase